MARYLTRHLKIAPCIFIIGRKEVIPGFEEAVEGMYQGESKTVTIPCAKAYGTSDPELLEKIDRSMIGQDVELQIGGQLEITNHDGSVFHVMIKDFTDRPGHSGCKPSSGWQRPDF